MSKPTVFYPQIQTTDDGTGLVANAGMLSLTRNAEVSGPAGALSGALSPWNRWPVTIQGKVVANLTVSLVAGGDRLADIATLGGRDEAFGQVASDPAVSRLIAISQYSGCRGGRAGQRTCPRSFVVWALLGDHLVLRS